MPTGQQFSSNTIQTSLVGGIGTSNTAITVQSSVSYPATPFSFAFDIGTGLQELCDCTNVAGVNWTIVRAIDGGTASAHSNGATITHVGIGRDFRDARTHIDATSGVHGATGSVVGTSDTQTLTNKVLGASTTFSANLVSSGSGTALDLSANTGFKSVIGPQLRTYSTTVSGPGFSLGNGTVSAGYIQYGKQTFVEIFIIAGTTTAWGTNSLSATLPLAPTNYPLMDLSVLRPSTNAWFSGRGTNSAAGSTTMFLQVFSSGGAMLDITNTVPLTIAAGDVIFIKGVYQAAS